MNDENHAEDIPYTQRTNVEDKVQKYLGKEDGKQFINDRGGLRGAPLNKAQREIDDERPIKSSKRGGPGLLDEDERPIKPAQVQEGHLNGRK